MITVIYWNTKIRFWNSTSIDFKKFSLRVFLSVIDTILEQIYLLDCSFKYSQRNQDHNLIVQFESDDELSFLSFDFRFFVFSSAERWQCDDVNGLFFRSGIGSRGCESFRSGFPTGERLKWGGRRGGGKNGKWSWGWPPPRGGPKWPPENMNGKWAKLSEIKSKMK